MLLTSFWITSILGMPPPVRMPEMLASVRSMVGYADEFFSGMVSPLRSGTDDGASPLPDLPIVPRRRQPSRLVWPILASTFDGNLTPGSRSTVSVGTQFFNWIARTRPTNTSATRTRLLALSANVSGIWM